jgi:hypothetical protein
MTAVEWLINKLKSQGLLIGEPNNLVAVREAKKMEKEQIIDAYVNGDIDAGIYAATKKNAEQYYKETFNK